MSAPGPEDASELAHCLKGLLESTRADRVDGKVVDFDRLARKLLAQQLAIERGDRYSDAFAPWFIAEDKALTSTLVPVEDVHSLQAVVDSLPELQQSCQVARAAFPKLHLLSLPL